MAIDVKKLMVDAFLELCKSKSLHKITIQEIVDLSGASRQTFYNHFVDKLALIQYTYKTRVIYDFSSAEAMDLSYYECCLRSMILEKQLIHFMKPACEMTGPNCLTDYMYEHSRDFDLAYHQHFYGPKELSPLMKKVSEYHSYGAMRMHINWILKGCVEPPEAYIDIWLKARTAALDELFFQDRERSPYTLSVAERGIQVGRE